MIEAALCQLRSSQTLAGNYTELWKLFTCIGIANNFVLFRIILAQVFQLLAYSCHSLLGKVVMFNRFFWLCWILFETLDWYCACSHFNFFLSGYLYANINDHITHLVAAMVILPKEPQFLDIMLAFPWKMNSQAEISTVTCTNINGQVEIKYFAEMFKCCW